MAHVQAVSRASAALAFEAVAPLNPSGYESPQGMAARGDNFELSTDKGTGIYGVCKDGQTLWCIAAAGQGRAADWPRPGWIAWSDKPESTAAPAWAFKPCGAGWCASQNNKVTQSRARSARATS